MVCRTCNLNARHRVSLGLLADLHPPGERTRVYVTEQASPAFRWIQARYPEVVGSEFFTREQKPELQAYLRRLLGNQARLNFEDVTNLSFADESFDAIVSSDVLEHVPDFRAALKNFHRVLANNGDLILTVPFLDADERSVRRAEIDTNGEIRHLVEPEYHGDPVSPEGVLAFHSFGWDLLDALRECGFQAQFGVFPGSRRRLFSGPVDPPRAKSESETLQEPVCEKANRSKLIADEFFDRSERQFERYDQAAVPAPGD